MGSGDYLQKSDGARANYALVLSGQPREPRSGASIDVWTALTTRADAGVKL